jgi:integrase
VVPTDEKRAVTPGRRPNADYRKREHLTEDEIEKPIEAAKSNRHGHRDSTMILVAYRHGLRASEICELRWDDIDFRAGRCTSSA